ncbi:hypothetical protein TNCT_134941 [Trichonephila clavata]|uniref:Uncharacterized protein n=1 Tax=Trichonephila clavata TaxID=2740835 RepID=A0A8X6GLV6_TRICU|nr:hypothetical protein TNCT_134941 [Trichonephila clavata]
MMGAPTRLEQRMAVNLEHLVRYHEDGNDFLFRIVTGDESGVSPLYFRNEGCIYGVETSVITCVCVRKKFKATPFAEKSVFEELFDTRLWVHIRMGGAAPSLNMPLGLSDIQGKAQKISN